MGRPADPRITVTSSEAQERKHLVQPYADEPVMRRVPGKSTCEFCSNPGFRRSRLRWTDALRLLLLLYPVRCTRCNQRQFVAAWVAAASYGSRPNPN